MALGLSAQAANTILSTFTSTYPWVQLHDQVGQPGPNGTSNVAGSGGLLPRRQASWNAASGGSITNSAALEWTDGEVDEQETYTYFTLWRAGTGSAASDFGGSGSVTASQVQVSGDSFSILTGGLTLSFTVAT